MTRVNPRLLERAPQLAVDQIINGVPMGATPALRSALRTSLASWRMTECCELLEWDSRFFGRRVARLMERRLDDSTWYEVNRWCCREEVDVLYFLADASHPPTVRLAQDAGFRLMDVRVSLHRDRAESGRIMDSALVVPRWQIREARADDMSVLAPLASTSFTTSRFYNDPLLAPYAPALYEAWIQSSYAATSENVLVACGDEGPVGFVAFEFGTRAGRISLLAVDPSVQGQGVGRTLVDGALRRLTEEDIGVVSVVTQAGNQAALGLYQRCGFAVSNVQLWYHQDYIRASTAQEGKVT